MDTPPVVEPEEVIAQLGSGDAVPGQRAPEGMATMPGPSSAADPPRSVALQLAAAVHASRDGAFEVQLSPEELGKVTMSLQVSDGAVVLAIQAERPETLDLMRRHIDVLEREFREAGYTSLSFTFGQSSADGRAPGGSAYSAALQDRPASEMRAAESSGGVSPLSPTTRLDLRL